tara:strand:- start:178 stop:495 length:318 start_codon:yes stop_codon:yes gene_type:complete
MKLTQSQLRRIIKEELEAAMNEGESDPAADLEAAIGAKLGGPSPRASNDLDAIMAHYRMGPARDEFDNSVNAILRGESNADAEAAKLKDAFEQRMFTRRASYAPR